MSVQLTSKELDILFKLFMHHACNTYKTTMSKRKKMDRKKLLTIFDEVISKYIYFSSALMQKVDDVAVIISKIRLRLEYLELQYKCYTFDTFLLLNKDLSKDFIEIMGCKGSDISEFFEILIKAILAEEETAISETMMEATMKHASS